MCLLAAPAWADEPPPPAEHPPPPAESPPPPAEAETPDEVHRLAADLGELADLARQIGVDTGSHEADRLARALDVASVSLEVGALLAAANEPGTVTRYWSAS